ncbi:tryptophan 2-C-methyltransferase [Streptomyces sp. NPDC005336]|uniref:tryptophan 2-C-methyltransferase n=1 Tax=Streptomyces sp. NPDC005336 TaxID=3157035 RepID=UPI0033A359E6
MNRLVTLVNPNRIHPAITPYALDILTTSLEQSGFEVEVVDLTLRRDHWERVLADYFRDRRPLLVGVTIRNTDTIYPQEQKVFLGEHKEIVDEIRRLTEAPIVAGGVGFSSMPFAAVDYFGIDYGVKGPGEIIISRLADALAEGKPVTDVPGLLINRGGGHVERIPVEPETPEPSGLLRLAGHGESRVWQVNRDTPYTRRSGDGLKVDNLQYYERGGPGNILTKNGCPFRCSHCVEPDAKGGRFALRSVHSVVDEMELLTSQGVHDLHTTDSEFNLAIANSKTLLREIVRRKHADAGSPLHNLRLWIYSQPAPFDDELAELLAEAGCAGVNVAPDHVREDLLDGWKVTQHGKRYYRFEDLENVVQLTRKHGMQCMIEVLLGMPGETIDTLRECIDRTMELDATVVGFTLGLRIFPYSPLGMHCAELSGGTRVVPGVQSNTAARPIILRTAEQCESPLAYERQFMFEESGAFRPLYYFSPGLPETPETLADPAGRWLNTLQYMWEYIPEPDYPRVMLPTAPGLTQHDNNYADNPFLTNLVALGYKGAFWSRWRDREKILREAAEHGLPVPFDI